MTGMLALVLAGPAGAQGVPPARQPAPSDAATSVADRRAQLWAATARFVYADDPALANVRADLEQTIDDASLKTFARSLDDAVRVEQSRLPKQNHVLTFQGKFKEVQQQNIDPANLPALAAAIQNKLESNHERMADPARRQRLKAFLGQLNQLAGATATTPAVSEAAAAPASTNAVPAAGPAIDSALIPEAAAPAASSVPASPPANTSSLPMISLVLSVLSLLGVLYLLLTRNQTAAGAFRPESEPSRADRKAPEPQLSTSQYEELRKAVKAEVAAALGNAAARPTAINQKAPARTPTPTAPSKAGSGVPAAAALAAPSPAPPSLSELAFGEAAAASAAPPAPRLRTIYVNQQPLDGAFRRDNLADAPASYSIFEITVDEQQSPDYGTFVVTRNEAAHGGYIGSHHSILEPAAIYNYPQGAVSRIITDVPGTVQRLPSGDWQIMQKAQIHFV